MTAELLDTFQRPLKDLRISVTDRCSLRCLYCMPLEHYDWIERPEILTYEEIERAARAFVALGVEKIRLTGGEPLLRRNLDVLVRRLAQLPGLRELSLTTNGILLAEHAQRLKQAGLRRINLSLDTIRADTFRRIAQRDGLDKILRGLDAALAAGLQPVKINSVILRGINDGEILELVDFARERGCELRFIEYMDVGNANAWSAGAIVSQEEILKTLRQRGRLVDLGRREGRAPSHDFGLSDAAEAGPFGDAAGSDVARSGVAKSDAAESAAARVGVIGSVTQPFCGSCSRGRLTADGKLVTCLFASGGTDLKKLLRSDAGDDALRAAIADTWRRRTDQYSVERLRRLQSDAGYEPGARDKIEMIRLGG